MKAQEIEIEMIRFLENNILAKGVKITADSALRDVGIDSFSIVEIILFIERKYGFVIPDQHLVPDNFRSIKTIAAVVLSTNP